MATGLRPRGTVGPGDGWGRHRPGRLALLGLALLFVAWSPPVRAQTPPVPTRDVAAVLPEPAAFGPGWERVDDPIRFVPSDAFRDGVLAAYGGPVGARVVMAALAITDERVAVRAAWEAAVAAFDRYRHDLTYDDGVADELAEIPPPAGCAEAKRIEGVSERDTFATGVTLCAVVPEIDPELILLAVASGEVAGATGYAAADAVLAAALAGRHAGPTGVASPAP